MTREKLLARKHQVYTVSGKYLFSVSMTDRESELLDNADWDKENESWLAYRNRTKQERINEDNKRCKLTSDIVSAYNEKHKLE